MTDRTSAAQVRPRSRWRVGVVATVVLVAGCQAGQPSSGPTPAVTPGQGSQAGFRNPVYDGDFPDPMLIQGSNGSYVAVATNGNGSNVQTVTSPDLIGWQQGPDALPELPEWSSAGKVWAPEIIRRGDGRYLLYYTTRGPDPDIQCISVALGSKPEGPFADSSTGPLVCDAKLGGSIDPSPFTTAAGERYLYWKNDGNGIGVDTYIWGQKLNAAGTKRVGQAKRLFKQDLPWEGNLVEAPYGWQQGGRVHLFYSANAYDSDRYAVGHAVSRDPLGPFTKAADPVLVTNEVAAGPGHCALFTKDGKVWMVYHAWPPDSIGSETPGRTVWLSEVSFGANGDVAVVPPTADYPTRP